MPSNVDPEILELLKRKKEGDEAVQRLRQLGIDLGSESSSAPARISQPASHVQQAIPSSQKSSMAPLGQMSGAPTIANPYMKAYTPYALQGAPPQSNQVTYNGTSHQAAFSSTAKISQPTSSTSTIPFNNLQQQILANIITSRNRNEPSVMRQVADGLVRQTINHVISNHNQQVVPVQTVHRAIPTTAVPVQHNPSLVAYNQPKVVKRPEAAQHNSSMAYNQSSSARQPGVALKRPEPSGPHVAQPFTAPPSSSSMPSLREREIYDMKYRISVWNDRITPEQARAGVYFDFFDSFGWGRGWKVCKNERGIWVVGAQGRPLHISVFFEELDGRKIPHVPQQIQLPGASTASTNVPQQIQLPNASLRPTNIPQQVQLTGTTLRLPVQADKSRLARDVLNALGKQVRPSQGHLPQHPATPADSVQSLSIPSPVESNLLPQRRDFHSSTPFRVINLTPSSNPVASASTPSLNAVASTSTPLTDTVASTSAPLSNPVASTSAPLSNPAANDSVPLSNAVVTSVPFSHAAVGPSVPLSNPVVSTPSPPSPTASPPPTVSSIRASTPMRSSSPNRDTPHLPPSNNPDDEEPLFLPSASSSRAASPTVIDITVTPSRTPRKRRKIMAYVSVPPPPPHTIRYRQLQEEKARRKAAKGKGRATTTSDEGTPGLRRSSMPLSVEEEEYDYLYDAQGTRLDDDDERKLMEISSTRLRPLPCKWDRCEVVMNSACSLLQHLRKHHQRPNFSKGKSFLCSWSQCGKQCKYGDRHLMKHAFEFFICPYEGCEATFRTLKPLARHASFHNQNKDPFKPSWKPFRKQIKEPPPYPVVVPAYLVGTLHIKGAAISRQRHEVLSLQVKRDIASLSKPRYDRTRTQKIKPSDEDEDGGEVYRYEYLTDYPKRYACYQSVPVDNIRFRRLDSDQVLEDVKDGLVILGNGNSPAPLCTESDTRDQSPAEFPPSPTPAFHSVQGINDVDDDATGGSDEGAVELLLTAD